MERTSGGGLGEGAVLQEINGEKRPEKPEDYFIVSNSTIFEINVIFI